MRMTYRELVGKGEAFLKKAGIADAREDAWLLLAMVCKIDRNFYYMHMNEELPEPAQAEYTSVLQKRAKRIPLQHMTGEQEFMGLRFLVNSDVLIPRQDTEILVEEAIKKIRPGMDVLDVCTGSGCIIISIAKNISGIRAAALDISREALLVAKNNAKLHGVSIEFSESDLFAEIHGTYDVIISNPPYIPTDEIDTLMPEVREFEPHLALDGSQDGLLFYRRILDEAQYHLKPGGHLLFEIGCDQGQAVCGLLKQAGYSEIAVAKDLAGLDRVVMGTLL